ncbi:MAG TPA: helix-turn-helix domain-containing protein [Stenotrophomonas sp.]|jgi:CRP/FNR family transcriptional regulator
MERVGTDRAAASACAECSFKLQCPSGAVAETARRELDAQIERGAPLHAGTVLYRQGESFRSLAVVRLGSIKTLAVDRAGREQVLGFHLAGDLLGMDAIDQGYHRSSAVALDTVVLCRLPFAAVAELASRFPELQGKLFRLLSRDIARAVQLSGPHSADERLAAFLVGMADRLARRGYSHTRCQLSMSRSDIASYLRLAPETVSRLLRRFQQEGLLLVEGRDVELRGHRQLQAMAAPILRQ